MPGAYALTPPSGSGEAIQLSPDCSGPAETSAGSPPGFSPEASEWYPGDDVVDLVGYDKYNAAAYTGDTLYYVLDGELYSTQGDKGVRNKQFENVLYVKALTNDVLVITVDEDRDGENEIYACANGHDFNRVSR